MVDVDESFDLRLPDVEARLLLEGHDEFVEGVVRHHDGEGEVAVLRGVDYGADVPHVDAALESKFVAGTRDSVDDLASKTFALVVCDAQNRLLEQLRRVTVERKTSEKEEESRT